MFFEKNLNPAKFTSGAVLCVRLFFHARHPQQAALFQEFFAQQAQTVLKGDQFFLINKAENNSGAGSNFQQSKQSRSHINSPFQEKEHLFVFYSIQ